MEYIMYIIHTYLFTWSGKSIVKIFYKIIQDLFIWNIFFFGLQFEEVPLQFAIVVTKF